MEKKIYLGTKTVKAAPMTLGEYKEATGRDPYANFFKPPHDDDEGYIVEYSDGYVSWSPKKTFEDAYRPSGTWQERLLIESEDLRQRIISLHQFIYGKDIDKTVDGSMLNVLEQQLDAMKNYYKILRFRIKNLKNTES